MVDQTLFYALLLTIIALILLLVGVLVLYLRLVSKLAQIKDEEKKVNIEPQAILAQAQGRAQKMIEDAHTQAREILTKAQTFMQGEENLLVSELQKTTQIYAKKYEESLTKTQDESVKMLQNVPQDIRNIMAKEITELKNSMLMEVAKAQEGAKAVVVGAYKAAEAEVENYKKQRIKQVDDSAVLILQEVARRVLAKEINQDEHEKLVLKALEEAKRQGLLI